MVLLGTKPLRNIHAQQTGLKEIYVIQSASKEWQTADPPTPSAPGKCATTPPI